VCFRDHSGQDGMVSQPERRQTDKSLLKAGALQQAIFNSALERLPKVLSAYPLSPQRGERVRAEGGRKKLLATSISDQWTPGEIGVGRVTNDPGGLKLVPEAAPVRIEKK
jgi:hypothetical protein